MKIGIIGNGQLAQMMILAGIPLAMEFITYAEQTTATTATIAPNINADFDNDDALKQFIDSVDVITYENENIDINFIEKIAAHKPVFPNSEILAHAQDRLYEKNLFTELNIPTNCFIAIDNFQELQQAASELGFPLIIKSRRNGYDGKSQFLFRDDDELAAMADHDWQNYIAEAFVAFDYEISAIAVRAQNGAMQFYDICENLHRDGILRRTYNRPDHELFEAAKNYLNAIIQKFDYVGVITVEFFVKDNQLLANEIAPRVHNSGHWTIEACHCSQFENHLRAIAGLPLGSTQSISHSAMFNCLGELPPQSQCLKIAGAHLHDYNKSARPLRKVGHITLVDDHTEQYRQSLQTLENLLL